jgi:hypothetical protein
MLMKKGVYKRLILLFTVLIKFANTETVESNKFQEFVQIYNVDGKMLCGGVVIDSEFVATMASCLQDEYAYKVRDADGDKLILKSYKNMNGLILLKIQPQHIGQPIPTALSEPPLEQKCMVIGWDHDHKDNAFVQSVIELNYSNSFFDAIINQQVEITCESPAVKAVICNKFLIGLILKKCDVSGPNYSHVEVYKNNEWINNVFKCAVDPEAACNFDSVVAPPVTTVMMEAEATPASISSTEFSTTPSTTTTTTTESTTTSTTTTQYIPEPTMREKLEEYHRNTMHENNNGNKSTAEKLIIVGLTLVFSLIMY